ncbi:MAG TPA: hypothetical protein PLS69_04845 [Terricaulis sp.]|nr:hypothetical protein [Terricaulis sp.]HRP12074.1 hypothetical protein [Terricaulis sp.]
MGAIFNVFPLILIPVLIYNIWAFGSTAAGTDPADVRRHLETPMICVPMASTEPGAVNACQAGRQAAQTQAAAVTQAPEAAVAAPAGTVHWVVSFGDLLILLSLILLFIELLKSTSTGSAAIFNHALSMLVFIICLVEFLLHPAFATSAFFIILVMALLDVLAGVVVTIIAARRDVEFAGQ